MWIEENDDWKWRKEKTKWRLKESLKESLKKSFKKEFEEVEETSKRDCFEKFKFLKMRKIAWLTFY